MIKSMTGFGRVEYERKGVRMLVEIRSVNHRFCEISMRMPKELTILEEKCKKWIQAHLRRGRIDVQVSMDDVGNEDPLLDVNWHVVENYVRIAEQLKRHYRLNGDMNVDELIRLPDVIQPSVRSGDIETLEAVLKTAFDRAIEQLMLMRRREGQALAKDLYILVTQLKALSQEVSQRAPYVLEEYRKRLIERLAEWTDKDTVDPNRLMTEVALFADRADIREELTRLNSHGEQFKQILESDEAVGRKLDFLLQEMNREVNTIASKSHDLSISQNVVDMKSILEKMREQVQNIE